MAGGAGGVGGRKKEAQRLQDLSFKCLCGNKAGPSKGGREEVDNAKASAGLQGEGNRKSIRREHLH